MRLTLPLVSLLLGAFSGSNAFAANCTAEDFAVAVDQSGASLRTMTLEAQPKLQERMRRYRAVMRLSDTEYENAALDAIQDSKLEEFDRKSSELLLRVDSLGRVPAGTTPDCAKLNEVKLAAAELNTIVKAKSDYMLKRLDDKIAEAERNSPTPKQAAPSAPVAAAPPKTPEPAKEASKEASLESR